jgi:hypothetical protein
MNVYISNHIQRVNGSCSVTNIYKPGQWYNEVHRSFHHHVPIDIGARVATARAENVLQALTATVGRSSSAESAAESAGEQASQGAGMPPPPPPAPKPSPKRGGVADIETALA